MCKQKITSKDVFWKQLGFEIKNEYNQLISIIARHPSLLQTCTYSNSTVLQRLIEELELCDILEQTSWMNKIGHLMTQLKIYGTNITNKHAFWNQLGFEIKNEDEKVISMIAKHALLLEISKFKQGDEQMAQTILRRLVEELALKDVLKQYFLRNCEQAIDDILSQIQICKHSIHYDDVLIKEFGVTVKQISSTINSSDKLLSNVRKHPLLLIQCYYQEKLILERLSEELKINAGTELAVWLAKVDHRLYDKYWKKLDDSRYKTVKSIKLASKLTLPFYVADDDWWEMKHAAQIYLNAVFSKMRNEDQDWWSFPIKVKEEKNCYDKENKNENTYYGLVERMKIFRYPNIHGFSNRQHHHLMHLRARFNNLKEEILFNEYCPLSMNNWNQTLRKSNIFMTSYAGINLKALSDGKYEDKISQQIIKWDKGNSINMQEVVCIKVWTDFGKLRSELKKCYTFESMADILTLRNFDPNSAKFDIKDKQVRFLLEHRLCTFYWWRLKYFTAITKYAQPIDTLLPFYYGVNEKMLINKKLTGLCFCGPLIAYQSYHVAITFAKGKGMVLQITSQYPRLQICKAFDASLVSDYPEEREWIISFSYLQIAKVTTRSLNNSWYSYDFDFLRASKARSIFFAVHLF
eukprot:368698_1